LHARPLKSCWQIGNSFHFVSKNQGREPVAARIVLAWKHVLSPTPTGPPHVAFTVQTRAIVDASHAAGLAADGRGNGGPGLRPHDHPNYYGAYVLDPDGHNIEAVCHAPG
jgi:catechol 2,3-dioxygenase-like lactoylglutathione lyase family enzyme